MSLAVTATFVLADWIVKGLADGTFERVGGVIREVGTKHVVTWLKESGLNAGQLPIQNGSSSQLLNIIISGANLLTSGVNAGISGKEFANVNHHLEGIERASLGNTAISSANLVASVANTAISAKGLTNVNYRLGGIEQQLQQAQGILQITSATSILSLGVSVMGFAVVTQRLNELEQRLKQSEELLNKIDRKIDIGYYANFKAALGLAVNAFTMNKVENRERMAIEAINRFLEAEHIYTDYTDKELELGSQIADEYLLTLSLAYIAEARCHLELGEPETALIRFQDDAAVLRSRIQKYVDILLTSNPTVYLQPQFKEQIDLRRLTKIYQWSDPTLDENAVFEMQRENLFLMAQDPNKWLNSLPSAILDRVEVQGGWFGRNQEDLKREAYKRLPQTLEVVESIIETNQRFEAYQAEVQAIAQLGISFHDWLKLTPSEVRPEGAELMFITPAKPL